jgi:uncharacterized repeat protein (TIGR03803 family)
VLHSLAELTFRQLPKAMNGRLPPSSPRRWLTSICIEVVSVAGLLAVSNDASAQLHSFDVLHTFPAIGAVRPSAGLIQATDGNFYGTTMNGGLPGPGAGPSDEPFSSAGTVFTITPSGTLTVLHAFNYSTEGGLPAAGLVQATDGNLYGTTSSGGASGAGTIFKISTTGTLTVLHAFSSHAFSSGNAGLVQATDGNLYGTTSNDGASGDGTVFRMTLDGAYTVLHEFSGADGAQPLAGLVQATDGNLYGTTSGGGASVSGCGCSGYGTVFRITTTGDLTVLHSFTETSTEGPSPAAALVQAADGNLYGTTNYGGDTTNGTVFKITTSGTLTVLNTLSEIADIGYVVGGLVQATDGNLYGTTNEGDSLGGAVFKITTTGTLTVLYAFSGGADGGEPPPGALIQGSDGNLWGTTQYGGLAPYTGTVFKMTLTGTETVVGTFSGGTEGSGPRAALVQLANGDMVGTTSIGGASDWGTIFTVTPTGTLATLHAFAGSDGVNPLDALVQATNGNLYGTASNAGAAAYGTVFQITPSGTLTVLHAFGIACCYTFDNAFPVAGLVQATDGNLYGTTSSSSPEVYKITTTGTLTVLSVEGDYSPPPTLARLVQATDGNLYGTISGGGTSGYGTVFRITTTGTSTVLHQFDGADGAYPVAGLIQATDGNLYGTTSGGGASSYGMVFQITPSGTLTILHAFNYASDGAYPAAGLIQARDGNLYGTAQSGGASGYGTVFKITPGGTLTVLHAFSGADGATPVGGVIQGPDGNLYGTTSVGGATGAGVVFRLILDHVPGDFDGDGKVDPTIYRSSVGQWWILDSSTNYTTNSGGISWGGSGAIPVPGDYDGDGKTDPAVYFPTTGQWWILYSSTNYTTNSGGISWGGGGAIPVPGDYDGDGKTDPALYFPSTGQWWILYSSTGYTTNSGPVSWGGGGATPVPGDYDGDGKTDPALYFPSTGQWWMLYSSTGYTTNSGPVSWGGGGATPVPGDYDGDGKVDPAVYYPSTGQWWILYSSSRYTTNSGGITWGGGDAIPVPGDYDGDGKTDPAVFVPSLGEWWIVYSSTNYSTNSGPVSWGVSTDIPVNARP